MFANSARQLFVKKEFVEEPWKVEERSKRVFHFKFFRPNFF